MTTAPTSAKPKASPAKKAAPAAAAAAAVAPAVSAENAAPVEKVAAPQPAPAAPVLVETAVEKAQDQAVKSYEDAVAVAQMNVEAFVKSGQVMSAGLQEIGQAVFALARSSMEETVKLSQQLSEAKTVRELTDLQSGLSKAQFDRLVAESSRINDLSLKLVEDAVAPITAQFNANVDRVLKRAS
jgi:phasin family protein